MPAPSSLSHVLDALPLPALAIDRGERIVAVNPAAQALLATPAEGRHFITVLRQPALVDAVGQTFADGLPRTSQFVDLVSGNETTYEVFLHMVAGADVVILSFQDVTHLAQAGQMRRDFVANVSHELRTPLTALMGFIETLRGPARDDPAARGRFLDIMTAEAERMNRLVGDLLSLSRVEAEERVRPRDQVDLVGILHSTLRNLAPLAAEGDVTFEAQLPKDDIPVTGDADQLQQVFTNLVENAIKYGAQGGRVDVALTVVENDAAVRGPAVHVAIRDTGPGIDPIHLPRLTERFYRADSHRSRSLGGTGLGLAIVKHILNRHRGRLKVTSELGKGAVFTVILPRE